MGNYTNIELKNIFRICRLFCFVFNLLFFKLKLITDNSQGNNSKERVQQNYNFPETFGHLLFDIGKIVSPCLIRL